MTTATPQDALNAFLTHWQGGQYREMALALPARVFPTGRRSIRQVKKVYPGRLDDFSILGAHDTDPAATNVDVQVLWRERGGLELGRVRYRMVYVDAQDRPLARHHPGGQWKPFATYTLPVPRPLKA
ncbi:hypothetical protein [Deinococcus aquaedulcis]|uniref:hypothetical protein n=1 Tax=Deinococcus aquaedulcis TaxID=2840455 RepID=UPI001C82AF37|nr:hypothetical protein [Deinococcus aquaedulcis]